MSFNVLPMERVTHKELRDPNRFEVVWDTYAVRMYRYIVVQLRSKEEAEDATTTTFIRLWEYVTTREGTIDNLSAFLYRIAKHCVIDAVRRRRPTASIEELREIGREIRDARVPSRETLEVEEMVWAGLVRLSPDDREILVWRFIEGIPVGEIAGLLSISENATSVRIYRALQKLKKRITK